MDVLITGDKDFSDIVIEKPEIVNTSRICGAVFIADVHSYNY